MSGPQCRANLVERLQPCSRVPTLARFGIIDARMTPSATSQAASATHCANAGAGLRAVRNGDLEGARTLLDLVANANGGATVLWLPLECAVHNNNVALARLFIERGANVNAIGKAGYTPMLLAASIDFGDTEMIELLLKTGARADIKNSDGKTSLDLAREYQHMRFVGILQRRTERRRVRSLRCDSKCGLPVSSDGLHTEATRERRGETISRTASTYSPALHCARAVCCWMHRCMGKSMGDCQ
jgi:hypothetical protein